MRYLLSAQTGFWDLVNQRSEENKQVFLDGDYTRGLMFGVRHLLVSFSASSPTIMHQPCCKSRTDQ